MLSYPAAIPLSNHTFVSLADLIRAERTRHRSRWRRLDPGRQALLVLAHLRNGDTHTLLVVGCGISYSTARRYVRESVDLLVALADDLRTAGERAARLAHAILDGTLVPIDRVTNQKPYYSGKHRRHGVNVQVLANPCRRLRINSGDHEERPHASPWQVRAIAQRCSPADAVLITTAAYTGLRWGELAGLQWQRVDLERGVITVDPDEGALHEVGGRLVLGPPKTRAGVRTVQLPPFLAELLDGHRAGQGHEHVFTATDGGGLLRRSNFRRRVWLPAVGGDPRRGWAPVMQGLHFHDLRHTHKTWLIEDGVPEVVQCKRLGHRLPGVRGTYSHVTQVMVDQLLDGLQRRWERTITTSTENGSHATYADQERVKIVCSQNAPTTVGQPVGEDHRQAV